MQFKNKRTLFFIGWMVLLVVMAFVMPDLNKLVVEKGQITISDTNESQLGSKYLSELNTDGEETFQFALVFHDEQGLNGEDYKQLEATLADIVVDSRLMILDSLIHTDSEQAAEQLKSEDGTTVLAQLAIAKQDYVAEDIAEILRGHLDDLLLETYVTGSDLVISDFSASTQEGVKKTEVIAIIFIVVILIVIFKSPIVPFVSLVSVGVSYLISLSIVALLVEHFNLPFSNFTQVFLVVILFGVGTDYNILLFTRFKEELAKQGHVLKAISTTYATAGKTVVFSGVAVLVGFTALFLAEFSMYQATAAVAIGVAILLLILLTLNPFFMTVFGFKMFWPIKEVKGHSDNKMWGALSKLGFLRPIISLLIVAAVTVPLIWHYSSKLNYNDLVEIDDKYESKQAVTLIEQHYDAGFSSPVSLVVKSTDLGTQSNLAELDGLAAAIEQVDGVAKVYSVTRPEGHRIEDLYVDEQSGTLKEGLNNAGAGVSDINEGLTEAEKKISEPSDLSGVDELINGTNALKNGASNLQQALQSLSTGISDGANGAGEMQAKLSELATSISSLKSGLATLSSNYETLQSGFTQFVTVFDSSNAAIDGAMQGYAQIEELMTKASATNPMSTEIQTALQIAKTGQQQLAGAESQLTEMKAKYNELTAGLSKANKALTEAQSAVGQMEQGANALVTGAGELKEGLSSATTGANQITTESSSFKSGLQAVSNGQQELKKNLEELQSQMATLAKGLKQSTSGLDEIYAGLEDANGYLADLNKQDTLSFFIPQQVLEGKDFQQSFETYMNDEQTLTNMTIILDVNPYTEEAMGIVERIDSVKDGYIESSSLTDAQGFLAGKTMANVDLQEVSQADFIRSAIVMMIGIVFILLWVTRSVFQSVIIIGSLFLTNFAALGLTEIVTKHLLGHEALSWNVPFFTLIMIITLGVDYSIFFMMRYNESKELGYNQVLPAAREIGGVIVSAAIILGGTFAALIPSGIITLIQVAIAVMIGLVLLSVFVMPILIPACFGLLDKVTKWKNNRN